MQSRSPGPREAAGYLAGGDYGMLAVKRTPPMTVVIPQRNNVNNDDIIMRNNNIPIRYMKPN